MPNKRTLERKMSSVDDLERMFKKQARLGNVKDAFLPYSSDIARKFGIKNGVDPTKIKGTGAKGTITKNDIENHLSKKDSQIESAMETVKDVSFRNNLAEPDMRRLLRMVKGLSLDDKPEPRRKRKN